jgi:hypothetical protein
MHSHTTHTMTKKKNGKEYEIKFYVNIVIFAFTVMTL